MQRDECVGVRDEIRQAASYQSILPALLLRLFVRAVYAAAAAELPELKSLRRRLLVLGRHVVAALALCALQHNVVTRHKLTPKDFYLFGRDSARRSRGSRFVKLLDDVGDCAGPDGAPALSDGEPQPLLQRYRR